MKPTSLIQDLIGAGRLESAWDMIKKNDISLDDLDYQETFKGFDKSQVTPMGGAWVQFDPEGTNQIYGSSDEFGGCDKNIAAGLIEGAFPDQKIYIRHS